jgi:hypothetical protein
MSTPISRHNKLQGLALYVPRHARERPIDEEEAAPPAAQEPWESDQTDAGGDAYADAGAGEDSGSDDEFSAADIHDWLDQAIREAVDLGRAAESADSAFPDLEVEQAPHTAPAQDETEDWRSQIPEPRRQPYRPAPAQDETEDWPSQTPEPRRQPYRPGAATSLHRPRLEVEIVPEPPAEPERSNFFRLFVRFSLVVAFAALVAYGLTMILSLQPSWTSFKSGGDRIAGAAPPQQPAQPVSPPQQPAQPVSPPPGLSVQDRQAFANEPVSLPIVIEHGSTDESLMLDGLVRGTTLSAGTPASLSSWRVPSDKLRGLYLYAPKDFVGVMNTTVDLLAADQRLLDRRAMQLKWMAPEPKPAPVAALAMVTADAATGHPASGEGAAAPIIAPIDPAEAAMLMQRGRDFMSAGDISAARVAFRRLADGGMADAALALADTYNPDYLATHNVVGVRGDRAAARALYQRARQLGSAEAGRILAQMAGN